MYYQRPDKTFCDEAEATVNGALKSGYRMMLHDGAPSRMSFTERGSIVYDSAPTISGHINDQQFLDAKKRMDDARQGMIDRQRPDHPDNTPRADTPPTVRDSLGTMPCNSFRIPVGNAPGQISVQDAKKAEEDAYARMVARLNER
jgi:hypothetical protein